MRSIVFCLCFFAIAGPLLAQKPDDWVYLQNGSLRLGVLRSSGAGLAYLSRAGSERNLLNHFDRGRLVQQSYYGDPDGSFWVKQPWTYNPVQGGDYHGQSARVAELKHDATTLYAKTIPRHWATGQELPECTMEQWVNLKEEVVHVRYQFTYTGTLAHRPHHQEIPAVFVDAELATLVTYEGGAPWTGAATIQRIPGPKNEYHPLDEKWAAYVGADGSGLGIYVPKAEQLTCYRFLGGAGSACSYLAPLITFALQPGLVFSYDAYLTVGTVEELRAAFAKVRARER